MNRPICDGPGMPLGSLGNVNHYRCRDCGIGFHRAKRTRPATPLERLRHHVTGAIERGEATAIVEQAVDAHSTEQSKRSQPITP